MSKPFGGSLCAEALKQQIKSRGLNDMGLKKCPKCELNYIRDDQKFCDVCGRKHKTPEEEQEELMCIECGEHPAMKGKELCAYCYKESLRQEQAMNQRKVVTKLEIDADDLEEVGIGSVDADVDVGEIPEDELDDIENGFGDDDMIDENEIDDEETDEEFDD